MSLDDRFRDAERIPVPDLWNDASSRAPGPVPPGDTARRIGVAAVAIAVAAAGFAVARDLASGGTGRPAAAPSPSGTDPHSPRTPARFGLVSVVVVSAQPGELIVEAPEGIVRWKVNASCGVRGTWKHNERNYGELGDSCRGGSADLEAGRAGVLEVGDGVYGLLPGRAVSEPGYRLRAILGDGRSIVVVPQHGLWLVVTSTGMGGVHPDRDSAVRRIELLDESGTIVAEQDLPYSY